MSEIMSGQNRPEIKTFGCRLNIWESEVMRKHAMAAGINDVVIVNSCAVTAEAEKQARQMVRKLRREKPMAKIIVTGCAVQIDPESWAAMPEADHILGNSDKLQLSSWQKLANGNLPAHQVTDIMEIDDLASHMIDSFDNHIRGFLQIQQGCDHRCTFCIIPYGRGPSRSVDISAVILSVKKMVASGIKEIVFSGVDITSWGSDLPDRPKLGELIQATLDQVPDLPRLRLSSIDPAEIDRHLMRALKHEARLMPHLHLSVQHGDDMILKRMKRRHLARDVLRFCEEARRCRPDVVFGADFIAGFPTESPAAHEASCKLIEAAGLTHLHVFGYSPRSGTPAAKMPQLERQIIKQRVGQLRALADTQLSTHLAQRVGTTDMLLMESGGTGHLCGFEKARLAPSEKTNKSTPATAGELLPIIIAAASDGIAQVIPLHRHEGVKDYELV